MRTRLKKGRAFLSHSHVDEVQALAVRARLEQLGIETRVYQFDLTFGDNLNEGVARVLADCDYFLLMLSDHAAKSEWVSRELGLALELQRQDDGTRPVVVGVQSEAPCATLEFRVLDYRTRTAAARPVFDFAAVRNLDARGLQATSELEQFAELLLPQVTEIDVDSNEDQRLLRASFDVYTECFPDEAERDSPEDIEEWLATSRNAESTGSPWRELYSVLSVSGVPIGMAFLTVHLHRHWAFGNYFGVRRGWRQLDRARAFTEGLADRLRQISPGLRGVVFEIEPLDEAPLADAAAALLLTSLPEGQKLALFATLRAARRLTWYGAYQARALMRGDGTPLPYWQPSMEETLDAQKERRLIPMVIGLDDAPITNGDVREIVDFIYDDLYADAYGGVGSMVIPGYREYVAGVKARIQPFLADANASALRLNSRTKELIGRAKRENLFDLLDL